ncbi:hypothetical protein [Roseivivax sediminis]|uniref:Uncharacterized protein n=1 Tax=Roseivivax sediminis TaxID=936889 RepID=A0A1I1TDX3_9RHOB|nr:hypothetical protein [Roseivivax sediminis]SFD54513.1 hypothetical protein SAMN04515678_101514 [Roseivivax sediminis]
MVYVVPITCLGAGVLAAHVADRSGRWPLVAIWTALLGLLMAWLIWQARRLPDWDGLGYTVAAALMCLPAMVGSGIGVLTGLYHRRRDGQEAVHDDHAT